MIGIGGGLLDVESELELIHVGNVEIIPVAAPNHPLARGRPNASGAARNHRQPVLTVRTPFSEGPDVGIFSVDAWRLADLGAKHALLLAGDGWGNMPEPNVRGFGRSIRFPAMAVARRLVGSAKTSVVSIVLTGSADKPSIARSRQYRRTVPDQPAPKIRGCNAGTHRPAMISGPPHLGSIHDTCLVKQEIARLEHKQIGV